MALNSKLVAASCLLVAFGLLAGALQFATCFSEEVVPDYSSMQFEPGHTPKPSTPFVDGEPELCQDGTFKCYEEVA